MSLCCCIVVVFGRCAKDTSISCKIVHWQWHRHTYTMYIHIVHIVQTTLQTCDTHFALLIEVDVVYLRCLLGHITTQNVSPQKQLLLSPCCSTLKMTIVKARIWFSCFYYLSVVGCCSALIRIMIANVMVDWWWWLVLLFMFSFSRLMSAQVSFKCCLV